MADAEGVVLAFLALRERREAVLLLDRRDAIAAAGQDLVRIALVADVPDQAVARRVEEPVQRNRELDDAEARAEMAARCRDRLDQIGTQLVRDVRELRLRDLAEVIGRFQVREVRVALRVDHRRGTAF